MQEVRRVESAVHALPISGDAALVQGAVFRRSHHERLNRTLHRAFDFCWLFKSKKNLSLFQKICLNRSGYISDH